MKDIIFKNINTYKKLNYKILIYEIIFSSCFIFPVIYNFNSSIFEKNILYFWAVIILLPIELLNRLRYLKMLNELMFLVKEFNEIKFKHSFLYRYISNITNYSGGDEFKIFINFSISYFILTKIDSKDFYTNKKYYIIIKEILKNKEKFKIFKELNKISIYNMRINGNLFLTHFLKYKYSNKDAEKEILFLLKNENINEEFLRSEGLSEDDIYYCLKRLNGSDE